MDALAWFHTHKTTEAVAYQNPVVIIHAGDAFRDSTLHILLQTLSTTRIYPPGTILIGTVHTLDNLVHISTTICGASHASLFTATLSQLFPPQPFAPDQPHILHTRIPQEKEEAFLKQLTNTLSGHITPKTQ